jgi:hypothetical protein
LSVDQIRWKPLRRSRSRPLRVTPLELVHLVLGGRPDLMPALASVPHEVLLLDCATSSLRVPEAAVHRVVRALDDGEVDEDAVRTWAAFVRDGCALRWSRPVDVLRITATAEVAAAVETLARQPDDVPCVGG